MRRSPAHNLPLPTLRRAFGPGSRLAAAAAGLALALGAAACSGEVVASPAPPAPAVADDGLVRLESAALAHIDVEELRPTARAPRIQAPGRLEFTEGALARVGSPVGGRVQELHVLAGATVGEGDALVTLTSPEAAAARAELAGARVALEAARGAQERQEHLARRGAAVEAERLAAKYAVAEAEAELARAEAAAMLLGEESGAVLVLRAPIAGTVLEVPATRGAAVDAGGDELVVIGDLGALRVAAEVLERDLPLVRPGMAVDVELAALGQRLTGCVISAGALVESEYRRGRVRIELDDPEDGGAVSGWTPGMRARVELIGAGREGLWLPARAVLIQGGKRHVVWVEETPGAFAPREVTIGSHERGRIEVRSGLEAGERVVVRGALLLDGAADQLL